MVPQDAPVVSVAVWESKAYLAVPRVWHDPRADLGDARAGSERETLGGRTSTQFLHDGPTLIESTWPEPDPNNATLSLSTARMRLRKRLAPPPRAFPRSEDQVSRAFCFNQGRFVGG